MFHTSNRPVLISIPRGKKNRDYLRRDASQNALYAEKLFKKKRYQLNTISLDCLLFDFMV